MGLPSASSESFAAAIASAIEALLQLLPVLQGGTETWDEQ